MKQHFFHLLILFLAIINWGCSPQKKEELPNKYQGLKKMTVYSAYAKPEEAISFKKEAVYGSSKDVLIGGLGDIAVDDSGRVFIADVHKKTIYVFEPYGQFIAQLGREGNGPGEFSYIKRIQIHSDLLYASDSNFGTQRVNIFTLDTLAGDKTVLLARNRGDFQSLSRAYPGVDKIYVRNNNTYLAEFIVHNSAPTQKWQNVEMKGLLYPLDRTGEIASEKLIEFKKEIRTYHLGLSPIKPFFGNAFTFLSSDNSIYWAGPDHFLIKEYSPKGDYRQAFYYPLKKIPLSKESAVEAGVHDYYIRNMKYMDLPRSWPVLTDIKIDDQDRLWVATTVNDMKVYQWWVLDASDGSLLARFRWPRDKPIEEIKNGRLYTRETEEETGLHEIVRYDIELTRD